MRIVMKEKVIKRKTIAREVIHNGNFGTQRMQRANFLHSKVFPLTFCQEQILLTSKTLPHLIISVALSNSIK